jgi:hypothetical protein
MPVCDVLLLIVLFVRRRATSFPIFTAYIAADAAVYIVLTYVSYYRPHSFSQVLWPLTFVQETITLLVAYELSLHVFRPTGVWASDVRKPLIGITGASIIIAFLFAMLAHPALGPHAALMWRIDLFYCILLNLLFVGILALSSLAGLPWKTHAARIAQGMCFGWFYFLIIEIVTNSLNFARLTHIYRPLMCIQMILALASLVYWFITLWRDEPAPQELPKHVRNQIYSLQKQAENDLIRVRSWRNN